MRLQQDKLVIIKNHIHAAQGVCLFLAWVLTIAVFTRDGSTDGRTGWFFALCWLTIPILVYLVMVPMWSRARKFSNVYAFVALDSLSIVLWLSAWAAVASYVLSGKGKGDSKDESASGCDNFSHGSPAKCKLSEATIVFGVIIMLLFCATAFISFKSLMYFKRTGMMPNQNISTIGGGGLGGVKPVSGLEDDGAFDSSMNMRNDFDDEDHDAHPDPRQGGGTGSYSYGKASMDEEYAPVHHGDNDYDDLSQTRPTQPGGPLSSSTNLGGGGLGIQVENDYNTGYGGAYGRQPSPGGFGENHVR